MRQSDRFKLRFGPYRAPRLRIGRLVWCEARGDVRVTRMSDGRIPWPMGRTKVGKPTLVLTGPLVEAVCRESNQAVAYWWGITAQTITRWRKLLGVGPTTEGTSALRRDHFNEPWGRRAQHKAVSKARSPTRRAKIAAAKRGKPRPRHVIEAMAKARTGMKHSEETRQRMSESHRKRKTRPATNAPG